MKSIWLILIFSMVAQIGCNKASKTVQPAAPVKKIEINLSSLDANGLRGPDDGKVSVAYEFCIPDRPEYKNEVKAIDKTVEFFPGAKGRIGANSDECLCIGNTHQPDFPQVIEKLSRLTYIRRIIECHFE